MPSFPVDASGVSKGSLVEGAYEYCGLNGYEFQQTPEEMTTGLRHLNGMLAEWYDDGIDLGFELPTYGQGLLEEPSNVPNSACAVIHQMLAQRLAPALGATLSPDAKAALSMGYFKLRSRFAATPPTMTPTSILPSLGSRHGRPRLRPSAIDGDPGDLAGIVGGGS
jgi:hypothetical protein